MHNPTMNFLADKTDELRKQGYCVLKAQLDSSLIDYCRIAFLPILKTYLNNNAHFPNRGTNRHFLPMPFEKPCFTSEFFFNTDILTILKKVLGEKIIADQWGCDVPLYGSGYCMLTISGHCSMKCPI